MYDLEDITKPAGSSPGAGGGLNNEVILMLEEDVESLPERGVDLVTMTGNITMKTGKYMHSIYGTPKTLEPTLKKVKGDNSDITAFEVGLKFFHPDLAAAILSFMAKHSSSKFYLILRNCASERMYFIGEKCNPLMLDEFESIWGKLLTEGKGTNFTFLGQQTLPYAIYAGTLTLSEESGSGSPSGSGA
ncbi:MAG: hypothetical protein EOM59_13265 [Clostridia bacterium]|nr:hypothetical protein [Clostridia bacterium]